MSEHVEASKRKPIFIGGTGRSGTSILGSLFIKDPRYVYYAEPRFLADSVGIFELLSGKIYPDDFIKKMKDTFLEKLNSSVFPRDLVINNSPLTPERIDEIAHESFKPGVKGTKACGQFIDSLFMTGVNAWEREFWVEKTPHTVLHADKLYLMFPDLRYIHIYRDPKDVCCSLLQQSWGPKDIKEFVVYYAELMEQSFAVMQRVPTKNYLVVSLEELCFDTLKTLERIMKFTEVPFESSALLQAADLVDPVRAHVGRWMTELSPEVAIKVDELCNPLYNLWKQAEETRNKLGASHS